MANQTAACNYASPIPQKSSISDSKGPAGLRWVADPQRHIDSGGIASHGRRAVSLTEEVMNSRALSAKATGHIRLTARRVTSHPTIGGDLEVEVCNRLPAAPLKDQLLRTKGARSATWDELAQRVGVSSRTLMRVMAASTLSPCIADRMSIRLGLHPALIWPLEWSQSPTMSCIPTNEGQE